MSKGYHALTCLSKDPRKKAVDSPDIDEKNDSHLS